MSLAQFHEARLPLALAFGAVGGPERRTEVVQLASGREARNAVWAGSRRRWELAGAVRKVEDLYALSVFFEARRGRLHGFRFRDPADDRSCAPNETPSALDQAIGTGDGATTVFPLIKRYGDYERRIWKPMDGEVLVAADGVELAGGFAVDGATGEVSFDAAPAAGAEVTAGFRFDTPVRFDTDHLETSLEAFGAGRAVSVPIVEITG
ncbi:MAG: DUF2460 domain-containing protein [Pseudomonadota bacterium]